MTTQSSDLRYYLRQLIRSRRQALTLEQQTNAAELLNAQLQGHPKIKSSTKIAVYLANDAELNPELFIQWCWQQDKEVYLPVLHPFTKGHLLFLRYTSEAKMITNKYGIKEPVLDVTNICPLDELDVLCTPLVAFDESGGRLGMGGGFYDRTLSYWQKRHASDHNAKPYPIGLAHDCQKVEEVPTEHWDIPIPEIITPTTSHIAGHWSLK